MLRVDVMRAQPGMTLALPVMNPNAPARALLAAGFELTGRTIERLRQLGVQEVLVDYPGLEELDRFIDRRVMERRGEVTSALKKTFEQVQRQAHADIPYEQYVRHMSELVDQLLRNPAAALFIDRLRDNNTQLLSHSTAAAHLSVLLGLRLGGYMVQQRPKLSPQRAREVANLGVGAMLHDIGLLGLEPEVLERYNQTGEETDPAWRGHVRMGYELVRQQIEPSASVVVLHHHQRYDGSGFPSQRGPDGEPKPLAGDKIHIFARIAAVADVFDEMRHPPDGEPVPAVRVLSRMLERPRRDGFDPYVLRALLQVAPAYPPGSLLRLSDGRWAVPVDHSPEAPCRPRVRIVEKPERFSQVRPEAESVEVDLREQPDLSVVEIDGTDVSGDNFESPADLVGERAATA